MLKMRFPWDPRLELQGSDSSDAPVRATPPLLGGDRKACNYTARAFRALTYLSPGKEKDEKTSAYLLVLTSEFRNLSFLVCLRHLCFFLLFFFFFLPSVCLKRLVLEVQGPFSALI